MSAEPSKSDADADTDADADADADDHPTNDVDDLIHQRTRLGIMTVLGECRRADFPYLKTVLGLTPGNLGRHLDILAAGGLLTITKGYEGKRPRTWAEITPAGRGALKAEMAALTRLVQRYQSSGSTPSAAQTY